MKKYYNTLCTIQRKGIGNVRGSQVETLVDVYTNIYCSIYKQSRKFGESTQALEVDSNDNTMVIDNIYSNVQIADVVIINNVKYHIINTPLANQRANGNIDNYEFTIKRTT